MSILFTLRKYIDPEQHGLVETDRRIERERPRDEADGAPPAGPPAPRAVAYECRVCALRSADGDYCPECLANTMVPLAAR